MEVRHKPDKRNVIPDALFRLASINVSLSQGNNYAELDALYDVAYAYIITLVEISSDFKARIAKGYREDPS